MRFLATLPEAGPARDRCILGAIACGALEVTWTEVPMGRVVLTVSANCLAIDDALIPMTAPVAQAAVDALEGLLPTPAMVDAIEAAPGALVTWLPEQRADGSEQSTAALVRCEEATRAMLSAYAIAPGALLAGHRKDVVLAGFMPAGRVVIYGARTVDGGRVQPVFPVPGGHLLGHDYHWADYSHAVRAVRDACTLDGAPARVSDILAGPEAHLLGGPVARLRYPSPLRGEA